MSTDLEAVGLSTGRLTSASRDWLITVDFESFAPADIDLWSKAMGVWADCTWSAGLSSSIFIALEDVAVVRAADPAGYARFLSAVCAMRDAGCTFHPHNHQFFDDDTGVRPRTMGEGGDRAPGYRKRISLYYDVVHREGWPLQSWLELVGASYRRFLADAGVPEPSRRAFRAGGWDNGSTAGELRDYVESLTALGYAYDSSATSGEFGTRTWRIGAPCGENVFGLRGGVTEVAPTFSLDCDAPVRLRGGVRGMRAALVGSRALAARPKPGVITTVLHFDHLFRASYHGGYAPFAIKDEATVARRIRAHFKALSRLRRLLRAHRTVDFGELTLL
jgi:hypothetical protein